MRKIYAALIFVSIIILLASCSKTEKNGSQSDTSEQAGTSAIYISSESEPEPKDVFEFDNEIDSGEFGSSGFWKIDECGLLIISGEGKTGDFSLENEAPWSKYKNDIKYIVIESGITNIGSCSFLNCENLIMAKIEAKIDSIGFSSFKNCKLLKTIEFSSPDALLTIDANAFENCYCLESAGFGKSINAIGKCAFKDCMSLDDTISLSKITEIEDYTFSGCEKLKFSEFPSSLVYIGRGAFEECKSLSEITIPSGLTAISESSFAGSGITRLTIPEGTETIEISAFAECKSLETISFPESLSTISMGAFSGCSSLSEVYIPQNVNFIDSNAFSLCTLLNSIEVATDNQNYTAENGVLYTSDMRTLKQYPIGNKNTQFELPSSVTDIEPGAFLNSNLSEIDVSSGNWTYTSLDGVLYTADLTEIVYYPTNKTDKSYTFYDSVTSVGIYAFSNCLSLESITASANLQNIGACAFENCQNLCQINLNPDMTEIGKNAFTNTALKGEYTFYEDLGFYDTSFPDECTINIIAKNAE